MNDRDVDGIAIIGMACRFPGANSLQQFWDNLCQGKESIKFFTPEELLASHIPAEVMHAPDYVAAAPVLDSVDHFDAAFFEFSPREARFMDPQQRLLLEVSWEAFEDAGYPPWQHSCPIGSFTGSGGVVSSYLVHYLQQYPALLGATGSLEHIGNDKDFLSTRIAYKLNLTGPSINVQTACSTSMVALHLACQSLLTNECEMALVGASTIRFPHYAGYHYIKGDILSPDGHCRPFDADAQGTIFGSGVAAIILKPLKKAIANHDHIYAVIKATAMNNDGGLKMSYTASSVEGQVRAIRQALSKANLSPEAIDYVECHGTGTLMGDPLEVDALHRAFAIKNKPACCPIGSVKGNIGHLEQTAGLAGLIKTALMLQYGKIPPSIHYTKPNPKIPFHKMPFYVNATLQEWPVSERARCACVNALGLGGTNAFVVLEQAPSLENNCSAVPDHLEILTLSAKNAVALSDLKKRFLQYLETHTTASLKQLCYTVNTGRMHFPYRAAYFSRSLESLQQQLLTEKHSVFTPQTRSAQSKKIVFLFTGQGSQYPDMAKTLYETHTVFRSALEECDAVLRSALEIPLLTVLYDVERQPLLNETLYTQPALFSISYALARLWQSWGMTPDAVMGHSVGEYAAACIADVFSLQDALSLIAERARLMHQLPTQGAMAVVFAEERTTQRLIEQYAANAVNIAAINGPLNTVIAGLKPSIQLLLEKCHEQKIETKLLPVSNGFHSFILDPMLPAFTQAASRITMRAPRIPWVSNLTGQMVQQAPDANYWANHARQPVRFQEGFKLLKQLGHNVFLEIGPGKTLLSMGRSVLQEKDNQWLQSLNKDETCADEMTKSVGQLYLMGYTIDWHQFYPNPIMRCAALPTYPFQSKRYHIDQMMTQGIPHPFIHEMKETSNDELIFTTHFDLEKIKYLDDHRMFNIPVMPTTAGLELALTAGKALLHTQQIVIENLIYERSIIFSVAGITQIACSCQKQDAQQATFLLSEATHQDTHYLSASMRVNQEKRVKQFSLEAIQAQCNRKLSTEQFYAAIAKRGLNYGPAFRGIQHIWLGENQALAQVRLTDVITDHKQYSIHPAFLDACLHLYPALVEAYHPFDVSLPVEETVYLPIGIERFYVVQNQPTEAWVYAELQEITNNQLLIVNIYLLDQQSQLIAAIERLTLRHLSIEDIKPPKYVEHLYQLSWQPIASLPPVTSTTKGTWVIFVTQMNTTEYLRQSFIANGQDCYFVVMGEQYENNQIDVWSIDGSDANHYKRVLRDIFHEKRLPVNGVIYFADCNMSQHENNNILLAEQTVCRGALYLAQAMLDTEMTVSQTITPRLWFMTQQTIHLIQAELWGMGRTLALEYPNLWGGLIDFDVPEALDNAIKACITPTKELQMAIRGEKRLAARLIKVKDNTDDEKKSLIVKENASYLITGGLGALGLQVAQWLVTHHHAKHLILIGRRLSAEVAIAAMQKAGITVSVYQVDVTHEHEVAAFFQTIKTAHPPLGGVIHCAGGLDDAVINKMTWDQFAKITRPKVIGSWLLHQYTKEMPLDFFILFSSILSLMGSPGQINYTAGNAFLDALGVYRRALQLPALVMNWGPWGEVGLATHAGNRGAMIWRKRGTEYLKPSEAMQLLDRSIQLNLDHAGVTITNWQKFAEQFNRLPLFYTTIVSAVSANQTQLDVMRDRFENSTPDSRTTLVAEILCTMIAALLDSEEKIDHHQSLNEYGLDSLIAVELINQIESVFKIRISAMEIIQGASIVRLSAKIASPAMLAETTPQTTDAWLVRYQNKSQPKAYLFCFPYAGGGPHIFKDWNHYLEPHIQTVAIHLPGRGTRLHEKFATSIDEIAQIMSEQLLPYLDKPFAFFGHSMGGLIMYEVALKLQKRQLPLPIALYPSGVVAPHLYSIPNYHEWNDQDFMALLQTIDFKSTQAILENEEMRQMLLPITRADLALAAHYPTERSGQYCFDIPIVAFGGTEDTFAKKVGINAWTDYTSRQYEIVMCPGNHYFIETEMPRILSIINTGFSRMRVDAVH